MKKIMFNDCFGLTQAVLEGRKTMTRRLINENYESVSCMNVNYEDYWHGQLDGETFELIPRLKLYEIVAVAQSYHTLNCSGYLAPEWLDHTCEDSIGYDNKMFVRADLMPHRIRITGIKVERLQDITEEDCLKEGVMNNDYGDGFHIHYRTPSGRYMFLYGCNAKTVFHKIIDRINGKGTWERNPWVFSYTFKLL